MKKVILLAGLLSSFVVNAGQSFRLLDGDLVHTGMTKIEVLDKLGQPLMKDVETVGVDQGEGLKGKKVESWSYRLDGSIGGEYLVTVTFNGDKATSINSIQRNR